MNPEIPSADELEYLTKAFSDVLNYGADDVNAPIDPLTYRAPDGDTCLHIASIRNDPRAVQLLLKAGAEVNAIGDMGYTPLHYATTEEVIGLLLAAGADPGIKNEFGNTPKSR